MHVWRLGSVLQRTVRTSHPCWRCHRWPRKALLAHDTAPSSQAYPTLSVKNLLREPMVPCLPGVSRSLQQRHFPPELLGIRSILQKDGGIISFSYQGRTTSRQPPLDRRRRHGNSASCWPHARWPGLRHVINLVPPPDHQRDLCRTPTVTLSPPIDLRLRHRARCHRLQATALASDPPVVAVSSARRQRVLPRRPVHDLRRPRLVRPFRVHVLH